MGADYGPGGLSQEVLRLGERVADLRRCVVVSPAGRARLTTIEAKLLRYLAERPGEAIPRGALLAEVWGYAPTVRSRAVDQTIKRLRPKIEADPAEPRYLITVHGLGYRFELPPEVTPPAPDPLPRGAFACLGREAALDDLRAQAEAGASVVQVVGPPGVGKSRLALAWATDQGNHPQRWPGGIRWVALQGVETEAGLVAAVDRSARPGSALLVLDDVGDDLPIEDHLSRWSAGYQTVLLTSRRRRPHLPTVTLQPLTPDHAWAMLCARFPDAAAAPAAARTQLLELLCGNPLAIALAASRLPLLGVAGLARRLQARPQLLASGDSGTAPHHSSLWGAIDLSVALLEPGAASALRQASVFAGTFSLEAAEAVISVDDGAVVDLLQELLGRSLLQRTQEGLALFGTVRQFAHARLLASPESDATRARHQRYFLDTIDDVLAWRPYWGSVAPRKHEVGDILQASRGAGGDVQIAGMLAAGIIGARSGERATWTRLLEQALLAAREACAAPGEAAATWPLLARALMAVQPTRLRDGGSAAAMETAQEAVISADRSDHDALRCWTRVEYSRLLRRNGQLDVGEAALHEAMAIARKEQLHRWMAYLEYELGRLHVQRGRAAAARQALTQARERYQRLASLTQDPKDGLGEALPLYALGYVAVEYGRAREAEAYFGRAIEIFRQAGDPRADDLVHLLGLVALDRGDFPAAERQFLRSAARSAAIGDRRYLGEDRLQLALLDHLNGNLDDADEGYRSAADHLEAAGHQPILVFCWSAHAALMAQQGRTAAAQDQLEAAQGLADMPVSSPLAVASGACGAVVTMGAARATADPAVLARAETAAKAVWTSLQAPRPDGDEAGTSWVGSSHMVRQSARLLAQALDAG